MTARSASRASSRRRSRSAFSTRSRAAARSTSSGSTWWTSATRRARELPPRRARSAARAARSTSYFPRRKGTHHVSRQIDLYDTTLRDGMQGEGMSLSADEKLRVAHALDGLGVGLIEAGFPSSNPKEQAVFDLLAAETFETAEVAAFGMTRRRDTSAADDPALRTLARSFAPICTLVGKT